MTDVEEAKRLLGAMTEAQQREVLAFLRRIVPPHPMEVELLAPAESLMEALARAPELTTRMIRGVIAEAAFAVEIIPTLGAAWKEKPIGRDQPYDFLLTDNPTSQNNATHRQVGDIRVQVKMQRSMKQQPLLASEVWKTKVHWPSTHYVVEMQRTRKGERGGLSTRPYRFGELDILAVSLGPARRRWGAFMYTLERWLLPDPARPGQILTFQPVAPESNEFWTSDFLRCVEWLRDGEQKVIEGDLPTVPRTVKLPRLRGVRGRESKRPRKKP
ncbi:MAG: hypothetical protein ACRENI_06830 [Gemmatimonadaceae bacterium]